MANFTAADVKALREKTGAGMMDVKKALQEADGDAEKALEIIRLKGLMSLSKREGRQASAGLLAASVQDGVGVRSTPRPTSSQRTRSSLTSLSQYSKPQLLPVLLMLTRCLQPPWATPPLRISLMLWPLSSAKSLRSAA